MGDYDLDTNMNTMNVQFSNGKVHQDLYDGYRRVTAHSTCKLLGIQSCLFEIMHFRKQNIPRLSFFIDYFHYFETNEASLIGSFIQ